MTIQINDIPKLFKAEEDVNSSQSHAWLSSEIAHEERKPKNIFSFSGDEIQIVNDD